MASFPWCKERGAWGGLRAAGEHIVGDSSLSEVDRERFGLMHLDAAEGPPVSEEDLAFLSHDGPVWAASRRPSEVPSVIALLARMSEAGVRGPLNEIHRDECNLRRLQCWHANFKRLGWPLLSMSGMCMCATVSPCTDVKMQDGDWRYGRWIRLSRGQCRKGLLSDLQEVRPHDTSWERKHKERNQQRWVRKSCCRWCARRRLTEASLYHHEPTNSPPHRRAHTHTHTHETFFCACGVCWVLDRQNFDAAYSY